MLIPVRKIDSSVAFIDFEHSKVYTTEYAKSDRSKNLVDNVFDVYARGLNKFGNKCPFVESIGTRYVMYCRKRKDYFGYKIISGYIVVNSDGPCLIFTDKLLNSTKIYCSKEQITQFNVEDDKNMFTELSKRFFGNIFYENGSVITKADAVSSGFIDYIIDSCHSSNFDTVEEFCRYTYEEYCSLKGLNSNSAVSTGNSEVLKGSSDKKNSESVSNLTSNSSEKTSNSVDKTSKSDKNLDSNSVDNGVSGKNLSGKSGQNLNSNSPKKTSNSAGKNSKSVSNLNSNSDEKTSKSGQNLMRNSDKNSESSEGLTSNSDEKTSNSVNCDSKSDSNLMRNSMDMMNSLAKDLGSLLGQMCDMYKMMSDRYSQDISADEVYSELGRTRLRLDRALDENKELKKRLSELESKGVSCSDRPNEDLLLSMMKAGNEIRIDKEDSDKYSVSWVKIFNSSLNNKVKQGLAFISAGSKYGVFALLGENMGNYKMVVLSEYTTSDMFYEDAFLNGLRDFYTTLNHKEFIKAAIESVNALKIARG